MNITCSFADSVLVIFMALYIRKLIDASLSTRKDQGFATEIIIFLVLVLIGGVILFLRSYSIGQVSANVMYDLRSRLYEHIEKLPISFIEKHHTAELFSSATNDISKIEGFLSYKLSRIIYIPAAFITTFSYMLAIRWNLLVVSLVIIPVVIGVSLLIVKSVGQMTYQLQSMIGESNSVVQDAISGMHILKAYNLKDRLLERYRGIVKKSVDKGMAIILRIAVMRPLLHVLKQAPSLLCVTFGGYLIVERQMTPGQLLSFLYLMNILVGIITDIPDLIGEANRFNGTYKHLCEILDHPIEYAEDAGGLSEDFSLNDSHASPDSSEVPVKVNSVSFSYDGETEILKKLDFSIEKGSFTAIVGPSGSGKSTLFKLLCGYYAPSSGTVEISGKTTQTSNLSYIRSQISLVSQEPHLFPVSIAENILYGNLGAGMDEIIAASRAANAHEFIMELPSGYDTLAGEKGSRLSGGQQQRISIARAIIKGAPIMLFDEPTSALDSHSDTLIQETVEKLKGEKTILVIAHRLSTIKNADEIIVLKEGQIEEKGTHKELMEKNGLYRQLYMKQYSMEGSFE